ncbi:hypothetical protein PpBr36_04762 [Pyricularia pennisetigena]|uniref:hypothetical protein n=1 Tax=Pyricularia pennisetigena TaxID=1578925 RepID=UPI001152207E|nr:hypothetical protein PpBr36_04762 [Pyricularia pennisetigena]TLS26388.1 hypothetical protein PpBr36_04762 [Pyricularia pennisetigena]
MTRIPRLLIGILAYAASTAFAEFTSKAEMWRAAEYDSASKEWDVKTSHSALTLVTRRHMAGETGPQVRYSEQILDLGSCVGVENGRLVWAQEGNAMKACTGCSVTPRLWPGKPSEPSRPDDFAELGLGENWDSFVSRWLETQESSYSYDKPENINNKAILTCNCAGEGGQSSSLDLDAGIYMSDDEPSGLHCRPSNDRASVSHGIADYRYRKRDFDDEHNVAVDEDDGEKATRQKRSFLLPSLLNNITNILKDLDMDKACADWRVVDESSGKRMLHAYCPVQGASKSTKPLYAVSKLDLDNCLVNDNGTVRFQEFGNGMRTCDPFFDTRGRAEWTTRCQAQLAMPNSTTRASITDGLDIAGRFKWRNHSLSCFPGVPSAETIVPIDWACKNVTLSRDAPGVISADCPADLGLDDYVRSTIDLNRCIGLNATEPGWPVAEKDGNAFEYCKDCELNWRNDTVGFWESSKTEVKSAVLMCTCRTKNATTFLQRPTVFIRLQDHIGWSPYTFRPVCLNGTVEGNRLMHKDPLTKAN